jgi:hypothetical protein
MTAFVLLVHVYGDLAAEDRVILSYFVVLLTIVHFMFAEGVRSSIDVVSEDVGSFDAFSLTDLGGERVSYSSCSNILLS